MWELERKAIEARIDGTNGIDRLRLMHFREVGWGTLDAPFVRRIIADLAERLGLSPEKAGRLTVAEAVAHLSLPESQADRPAGPPAAPSPTAAADPSVGSVDAAVGPIRPPGDTAPAGATHTAKGTPSTPKRRRGQALSADEKRLYERVVRAARRLNLASRSPGNLAKIAYAAKVGDVEVVKKALKWDDTRRRRHR
jgi:hypothetical protein